MTSDITYRLVLSIHQVLVQSARETEDETTGRGERGGKWVSSGLSSHKVAFIAIRGENENKKGREGTWELGEADDSTQTRQQPGWVSAFKGDSFCAVFRHQWHSTTYR